MIFFMQNLYNLPAPLVTDLLQVCVHARVCACACVCVSKFIMSLRESVRGRGGTVWISQNLNIFVGKVIWP